MAGRAYGYAFGAAVAGVSHVVRRDTMLYPGYVPPGILPEILHYGSDFAVELGPPKAASASTSTR